MHPIPKLDRSSVPPNRISSRSSGARSPRLWQKSTILAALSTEVPWNATASATYPSSSGRDPSSYLANVGEYSVYRYSAVSAQRRTIVSANTRSTDPKAWVLHGQLTRPGLHHLRDTVWPRKGHVITAIPASGAITRCWLSPPEPETSCRGQRATLQHDPIRLTELAGSLVVRDVH